MLAVTEGKCLTRVPTPPTPCPVPFAHSWALPNGSQAAIYTCWLGQASSQCLYRPFSRCTTAPAHASCTSTADHAHPPPHCAFASPRRTIRTQAPARTMCCHHLSCPTPQTGCSCCCWSPSRLGTTKEVRKVGNQAVLSKACQWHAATCLVLIEHVSVRRGAAMLELSAQVALSVLPRTAARHTCRRTLPGTALQPAMTVAVLTPAAYKIF